MTLSRELTSRRAAIFALAGVTIFASALLIALLFLVYAGQRADAADNLRQLTAYNAEVMSRPRVQAAYAEMNARISDMQGLVHAGAGAPAAAQVETALKQIVESNGGELRSSQALASTEANGFEQVRVECDLTVPASRLKDLFYAVETHRPYLFVDSADVTAPINWDTRNNIEPAYEVRFGVSAYRWIATQ